MKIQPLAQTRFKPRVCAGCAKPLGTTAIQGAFWHPACFRKASPEQREQARKDVVNDPASMVAPR